MAGGSGTRLYPVTNVISKQLLPVYDKPMIYYPLTTLMLAGIREILIISTPQDLPLYKSLLGDGYKWGIKLSYQEQLKPDGLAQALILGEKFIGDDLPTLILGDNIFYGHDIDTLLNSASEREDGATVFTYHVSDPERYGVAEFDSNNHVMSLEEKPQKPKSNFAVTGLYFYDNDVVKFAKLVEPSARGELEISSINEMYLKQGDLTVELLGRGFSWLDTGTQSSIIEASQFIQILEKRQGFKIACLEEIAWRKKWISNEFLQDYIDNGSQNDYYNYLEEILKDESTNSINSFFA